MIFHRSRRMEQEHKNRFKFKHHYSYKILKYFEWNSHIDYIKNKISNITGVLYNCRQYLDTKTMVNFYYIFFYPYVIYKIKG